MYISKVIINDFKQYYGNVEIDLNISDDKNVIVIGGKNGHGKTNFLISLVWCLYGSNIINVDEIFRKEVRGGYPKFLNKTLNWNARKEEESVFSVNIRFSDVDLTEGFIPKQQMNSEISVKREYNIENGKQNLEILIDGKKLELLKDDQEKATFINDYLIPIQAAKFVFFDAEKIADIAELNLNEQGRIMNEVLGKILGLDIYENLKDDFETYRKNLIRKDTKEQDEEQIESFENKKKINNKKIENIIIELDEIEDNIEVLKTDIYEYEQFLIHHGGAKTSTINIKEIYKKRDELEEKKLEVTQKLFGLIDLIPFVISAGKIQELIEQLSKEDKINKQTYEHEDFTMKSTQFVENLFNKEPYPKEDISLKQKIFYTDKAEKLLIDIFIKNQENNDLKFGHDLSKSEINCIYDIYNNIRKNSIEIYESYFSELSRIDNDLNKVKNEIRKTEGELEDETVNEYKNKKENAENEIKRLYKLIGEKDTQKTSLEQENETIEIKIKNLLDKVKISKSNKFKVDKILNCIKVLNEFIEKEKKEKCKKIQYNILYELKKLMHKDLIQNVKVDILPENKGLDVILYDSEGIEISKDDLSRGEQQIYVSSLLKAILNESVNDLPVFIDTPLGRLDIEHKENILDNYYPTLANQVIIFSTNDEITSKRLDKISNIVKKTYLLNNINGKTTINEGYF